MRRLALSLLAAAVAVALLIVLLMSFGFSPRTVAPLLVEGSIGSRFALTETLLRAVPLLLTALSVLVAFRAGVWNIGAEGQFIAGAIAAFVAAQMMGESLLALPVAVVAGGVGGALWAGAAALLRSRRAAPEVLTTILLNFVALHLLGFLVNGPLQEQRRYYPQSESIAARAELPSLFDGRLHAGVVMAVCAAAVVYWFISHSPRGLSMRAAGSNPSAAAYAGINVTGEATFAFLLSGSIAGLAGAIELLGVTHRLFERFAVGYGYSGITVALLAQLHPLGSMLSAFFVAALRTGAAELQRAAGVAAAVSMLGEGLVIIALLLFASPFWYTLRTRRRT